MTQDSEEWTDWIEHDGLGCPCVGSVVHIIYGDSVFHPDQPVDLCGGGWEGCVISVISPSEAIALAQSGGSWDWLSSHYPIIRYRIRKPRALRDLITLVENLLAPQRHTQEADG